MTGEPTLMLRVEPEGSRRWVQRVVVRGRRRDFGLGPCSLVSFDEACEVTRSNRKIARSGGEPKPFTPRAAPVETRAPSWAGGSEIDASPLSGDPDDMRAAVLRAIMNGIASTHVDVPRLAEVENAVLVCVCKVIGI